MLAQSALLRGLETASLDLRFRLRGPVAPGGEIATVMVDDASLAALGRWPLSRHLFARALRRIDAAGARVIVFDLLFAEPDQPVAADLREAARQAAAALPADAAPGLRAGLDRLAGDDPDGDFAAAMRESGKVLLPLAFAFTGKPAPDLKFFHMTSTTIAGKPVRLLRHGMAGQAGYELFGPYSDYDAVHSALVKAGEEFGMKLCGGRAYSSNTLESARIPSPLPAIYTGEALKPYREWLAPDCYEAKASIGGSFASDNIEDYYLTPWDLGYGFMVKFDHDFIGRPALEKIAKGPHRKKVTLALDTEDVLKAIGSQLEHGDRAKFIEFPSAVYAMHPFDLVKANGKPVGISTWIGYSSNERRMLTLAILDAEWAEPGKRVKLVWGEEGGGTAKPAVERHTQIEMNATVSPAPYVEVARKQYAGGGWRAG